MSYESVILILFVISSIVAIFARKVNLPYTVALLAVGLFLGTLHILNPPHLTQELLYDIFLPPLIYEAGIHLRFNDIKRDFWVIATLVIPGVILSTIATAAVLIFASTEFEHFSIINWSIGILFGAAVAATDPVAVLAIFKKLGAPRRLRILIESESLLNDGTAIVVFIIALQLLQGSIHSFQEAFVNFFYIVGFGLAIGVIIGLVIAVSMKHIDDAMIAITLTTVAAYTSFLIAQKIGVSGVMSTVAAGLVSGERGLSKVNFPSIRISTENFWEFIVFAMNSLIFLLMGFEIDIKMLLLIWPIVLLAYIAVLIARSVIVLLTWILYYPTKYKFPLKWSFVLTWGGLRGALSMVLALSIPESFAFRELIITMVFGVVLLSILIQGLTIAPILKLFNIISPVSSVKTYELLKTQIALLQNSLDEIEYMQKRRMLSEKSAQIIKEEFSKELKSLIGELDTIQLDKEALVNEEILKAKRRIIMEQKANLLDMYHKGAISLDVYKKLSSELDNRLFELENIGI